jgi:mono/diheme cytochrome c family protein
MRLIVVVMLLAWAAGVTADDKVDGAKIYKRKCTSCHGKQGEGNPRVAKGLKIDPAKLSLAPMATKSDEESRKIIVEGTGKMKPYAKKLSAEEIDAVLAYCRKLVPLKKEDQEPAPE